MRRSRGEAIREVRRLVAVVATAALVLGACGGDDDAAGSGAAADAGASTGDDSGGGTADAGGAGAGGNGGGGGGTIVLGDETISLDSARCFLQEQDAAAGGGKILFVAQGFGIDAAGEPVTLDVSRYDEDSQFVGDDIHLDIGDPFGDSAVSWSAKEALGSVTIDGSSLSLDGLTFVNSDDLSERPGSFEISC